MNPGTGVRICPSAPERSAKWGRSQGRDRRLMGRRLYLRIGTAIAAVGIALAMPAASAHDDVPMATPMPKSEGPLNLPVSKEKGFPASEAPDPFPAEAPADLGPEPPKAGPPPSKPKAKLAKVAEELPVPTELPTPSPARDPSELLAPNDPETIRAQAAGTSPATTPAEGSNLPAASERPGQPSPAAARDVDPEFVLPAERLPIGRQNIGLSVEVLAPQAMNIGQSATLKVIVRNSGATDALGVVVRDQLPEGLAFVSSQPEAQKTDALLSWALGTVAAGSERVITVSVKPMKVGAFEHAATVIMKAGGRSRTMVREPKLKLELLPATNKALRGRPVEFKIAITNTGDGPARQVVVQAKLSTGLRHEAGESNDQNLFEQEPIAVINPGERLDLPVLTADTIQGGEQTCQVVVQSPDVVPGSPDATALVKVNVVEPKLALKLTGPEERFTDILAKYELTIENPGTAPARNVKILATVPVSGRLFALPPGATWDATSRKLSWIRPQLDAGEKASFAFEVRMGGIGLYQVAVEARADTGLLAKDTKSTNVSGLADLQMEVSENRRVVDVGDVTTYRIKIVNKGTKEATGINISAKLSETVEPKEIYGTDKPGGRSEADPGLCIFPQVPRLGPGKMIELGIRVQAVKPGPAVCRVFLTHDESGDDKDKIEDFAHFKVAAPVRR